MPNFNKKMSTCTNLRFSYVYLKMDWTSDINRIVPSFHSHLCHESRLVFANQLQDSLTNIRP
jgi:hypothetical protein